MASVLDHVTENSIRVIAGETIYCAARIPAGGRVPNGLFKVCRDERDLGCVAMWFQPIPAGRARVLELPPMPPVGLANTLRNWHRRQVTEPAAPVSTSAKG
jgi:hypothetical protein